MEHWEKQKPLTDCKPNDGLNKSNAPQRPRAYIAKQTQPILMAKLNSVIAFLKRQLMEKAQTIISSVHASNSREVPMKEHVKNYIGIDIASETLTATIFHSPQDEKITKESIPNTIEGFQMMRDWFKSQNVSWDNAIICMEATGVYGEALTHYLVSQNFSVAVEPPLKVKRAFYPHGHKNDRVDSVQIAEYAYRFFDQLRFWRPLDENIERLKHFLSLREGLVKQSVAIQNSLKAYQNHLLKDQSLVEIQQKNLSQIKEHIAAVDGHIKSLINQNPSLHQLSVFLVSLCGVGVLLSAYMLVMTNGFQNITHYKQFAAFLGICPFEFKSGKSINKQSHCRPFGPNYAKKLFHLAARSVATHRPEFRKYYLRKIEQGKSKSLVLNNIANKLVKISFALVRDRQSYIKGYRSISPLVLQNA